MYFQYENYIVIISKSICWILRDRTRFLSLLIKTKYDLRELN